MTTKAPPRPVAPRAPAPPAPPASARPTNGLTLGTIPASKGHRIEVYGPGGIGKTTLAASAPGPVAIIDLDQSLPRLRARLDALGLTPQVRVVENIQSWPDLLAALIQCHVCEDPLSQQPLRICRPEALSCEEHITKGVPFGTMRAWVSFDRSIPLETLSNLTAQSLGDLLKHHFYQGGLTCIGGHVHVEGTDCHPGFPGVHASVHRSYDFTTTSATRARYAGIGQWGGHVIECICDVPYTQKAWGYSGTNQSCFNCCDDYNYEYIDPNMPGTSFKIVDLEWGWN